MGPNALVELPVAPVWVLLLACSVIVAESGLLIGVLLPGVTTMAGLGMLAALSPLTPIAVYGAAVPAATVGPSIGYWRARRTEARRSAPARRPQLVGRLADSLTKRPLVATAGAQWIGVARTLVPRLVATRLPYRRFLCASAPSAAAWAAAAITLGLGLGHGSRFAIALMDGERVLVGALVLVIAVTCAVSRLRRAEPDDHRTGQSTRQADRGREVPGRPGRRARPHSSPHELETRG